MPMAHSVKNKKFQNSVLQSKLIVAVLDLNRYVQQNILISWVEMKKKNSMQNNHLLKILAVALVIWIRHKLSLTTLIVKKVFVISLLYPIIYPIIYIIPYYISYYQEHPKNLAQNCWQKNWIHLWLGYRILRDL